MLLEGPGVEESSTSCSKDCRKLGPFASTANERVLPDERGRDGGRLLLCGRDVCVASGVRPVE